MAVRIIVALAVLAFASAQVCTPVQWEGYEFNYDVQRDFRALFNISYDATNQRTRVYATAVIDGRENRIETIAVFSAKTLYEIDHTVNRCRKITLNAPWEPDCLPTNSTLEFKATVGVTLPVSAYRVSAGQGPNAVRGIATVTQAGNVPVQYTTFSQANGLDHSEFFDITPGIKNAAVFTPPAICNAASPLELKAAHPGLRAALRR